MTDTSVLTSGGKSNQAFYLSTYIFFLVPIILLLLFLLRKVVLSRCTFTIVLKIYSGTGVFSFDAIVVKVVGPAHSLPPTFRQ